jgi:ParB family transcriptional regulator, chromosome partitioning protein
MSISTSNNARANAVQELRELPVDVIVPNPSQPRRHFGEGALMGLAGSIGERGVLQPVLVRPLQDGMYQLVAGERRWRAAKIAGLPRIPALVSRYDDRAALEAALIENLARENLNPVEEARAFVRLSQEFGLRHWQIGDRVGRNMSVVSNTMRLLKLSEEILELLERGELSVGHGVVLLMAKDLQARSQLARAAVQEGLTALALERRVRASNREVLPPGGSDEQGLDRRQERDLAALHLARSWGDLLGVEVQVRVLPRGRMRLEVTFGSAAEGIALADRLAAAIARGAKGR